MARGGGGRGRRTYVRDANGRFASTPGGGKPKVTGGTLAARTSARRSKAKLAAQNPADTSIRGTLSRRSQKGAVTRGQKTLTASRQANRMTVRGSGVKGVVRKGGKGKAGAPVKAGAAKSIKLSPSQRHVAEYQRTRFNEPNLGVPERNAVQAVMKKFGVSNRIAYLVYGKHGFRWPGNDTAWLDTGVAKKAIRALRALRNRGRAIGGEQSTTKARKPSPTGTIKRGKKPRAKPVTPVKTPSQIRGERKRASERPYAQAARQLERTRNKLADKQNQLRSVETSLNRRRGRLEGEDRRKAAQQRRKLQRSVERLRQAEQKYQSTIDHRNMHQSMMIAYRTRGKAPSNVRTTQNTIRMLGNRIKYLKAEGATPDSKALKEAQARRNAAAMSLIGTGNRVVLRSRQQAVRAQRSRTRDTMERARISGQAYSDVNGRVTIHVQNGYGVRKNARPVQVRNESITTPRSERTAVKIPVSTKGRRIKARVVGTQGDLFGAGKKVRSYQIANPYRSSRRRKP